MNAGIRLSRSVFEKNIPLLQLINDGAAMLYICLFMAFPGMTNAVIVVLMFFCAATVVNAYLSKRKVNICCLWGIALYGFCLLSGLWAYSIAGVSTQTNTMVRMMLLAMVIPLYVYGKREMDIVFKSVVLGARMLAVILLINTPLEQWGGERLGGSIGMNQNAVGAIFVYASAICLYYVKKSKLYLILLVIFVPILLFTGSRKAFVSLLLVITAFFANKIKKPLNLLYIVPFGVLFISVIYLSMNNPLLYNVIGKRMEGLLSLVSGEGKVDTSALERMELISIGIGQFKEKMFIGYGMNSFRYMNKYFLYAHNNYIELLVNGGIIGAALYYAMPVAIFFKAIAIWLRKTREVIIILIFMALLFVNDYGSVTYYTALNIVLLVVSYRAVVIMNAQPKAS